MSWRPGTPVRAPARSGNGILKTIQEDLPPLKPVKVKVERQKYPQSLKPGWQKKKPKPLIRFPDGPGGREVINLSCPEGFAIYRERVRAMWTRQKGVCCLSRHLASCPGALRFEDAVFEHEYGRGFEGCKRDDRIEKDGRPLNGAAHYSCNREKASKAIYYNRP